ncbi:MAG: hypothetical protein ABIG39_05825 [Candidatus Micrarchaeota archaeon]
MRLVTHNDFDGIACAVLISSVEEVDYIMFADPSAIQHREFNVREGDIITDLPYHPKCAMWFDHHASNKPEEGMEFEGSFNVAPSAARVVFDYYENPYLDKFKEMVEAADKIDSGNLTLEEVNTPQGYQKISITLDSDDIRNDHDYRRRMVGWLAHKPLKEILGIPEVSGRFNAKLKEYERFKEEIPKYTRLEGNVCITDVRGVENPSKGPSYLIYAIWPRCNVSVKVFEFPSKPEEIGISVGHNVFNKTCRTDIGALMKKYKGGGHPAVGGCRVKKVDADMRLKEIIEALKEK